MLRIFLPLLMAASAAHAAGPLYELAGRFTPAGSASVSLFGVSGPFSASTLSDASGRFTFRKLEAGTYTLAVFLPADGEARQTIEIGPSTADGHHRVSLSLQFKESDFVRAPALARHTVTTRQLAIPDKALRLYDDARKFLSRRDSDSATQRLEEAVDLAPSFRPPGTSSARSPTRRKNTPAPKNVSARRWLRTPLLTSRWSTSAAYSSTCTSSMRPGIITSTRCSCAPPTRWPIRSSA